jgi:hypothetical protein
MAEIPPEQLDVIHRVHSALDRAKTQADCERCLDRAWELLPAEAAEANTIVVKAIAKRRAELRTQ